MGTAAVVRLAEVRSGNGAEFTANAVRDWLGRIGRVRISFIEVIYVRALDKLLDIESRIT